MNRHNGAYWTDENPKFTIETQCNQPGVTARDRGQLSSEGVIGPFFFFIYGSVNGENYLEMLRQVKVPLLHTKPNFHELLFQQDGALPHYVLRIRDYPEKIFPQHWF